MTVIAMEMPGAQQAFRSGALRLVMRHSYILPASAVCVIVGCWFVTWGDWSIFFPELFCRYYDDLARSMLHGCLDVPRSSILIEAFRYHGKFYGYFGIAPALLRMPLVLLLGDLSGLTSRSMMLLASGGNVVCAYGIVRAIRQPSTEPSPAEKLAHNVFIICCGIGSTNIFLLSRAFVYHEAMMWEGTFALACAWSIIAYAAKPRRWLLVCSGASAFFSFHSRPIAGAGALLALVGLGLMMCRQLTHVAGGGPGSEWQPANPPLRQPRELFLKSKSRFARPRDKAVADLIIIVGFLAFTVAVYCGVNYAKFRTFDGIPMQYYELYRAHPERMQTTGGRQIHPENIPTTSVDYFGVHGARLSRDFPWVLLQEGPATIGHPVMDLAEPFSSIPVSMPALALLAVAGGIFMARGASAASRAARIPAIGLLLGGSIILMGVGISERYLHDFYPALVVAAAAGLTKFESASWRKSKLALLVVLALISIWCNCAFALVYQRITVWGVGSQKTIEFERWQQDVRHSLGR